MCDAYRIDYVGFNDCRKDAIGVNGRKPLCHVELSSVI